jgi:DNA-binding NtrC family response regulator
MDSAKKATPSRLIHQASSRREEFFVFSISMAQVFINSSTFQERKAFPGPG